jgi:hypothetical protein
VGVGFLDFVDPWFGLEGGGFVNWEPTVIYPYTRKRTGKTRHHIKEPHNTDLYLQFIMNGVLAQAKNGD